MTNCGSSFCKLGYTCDLTVVCFFSHYLSFFWFILLPKAQINFPKHKLISRTKIISHLKTPTNFFKHRPISQNTNQSGLGAWLHEDPQREPRKTLLARILLPITRLWPVRLSFAKKKKLMTCLGLNHLKQFNKPDTQSRVCITLEDLLRVRKFQHA